MALSALADKAREPTAEMLAEVLGPSMKWWTHIVARMDETYGPLQQDWSFSGAKYGWIGRLKQLKQKKRTILRLTPQSGTFLVGMILGDRALGLLRRDELSPQILQIIDEAPKYGEGTGFTIPVTSKQDCDAVEVVIGAKMA